STNPKDQITVDGLPQGIAINTVTNKVYVLNRANGTVAVIDSNSGEVKNIHVGNAYNWANYPCPHCIGVDSQNNKIYVANTGDNTVSVINGANDTVRTVPVGTQPNFVLVVSKTYSHTGDKIYVGNSLDNTVSVINGTDDTVTTTVPIGGYPIMMVTFPSQ